MYHPGWGTEYSGVAGLSRLHSESEALCVISALFCWKRCGVFCGLEIKQVAYLILLVLDEPEKNV